MSPRTEKTSARANSDPVNPEDPSWIDVVTEKVGSLKFGVVQIVIHDRKVVQVESTERHRFDIRRGPEKP